MVTADDEGMPRETYILGMQLVRSVRARVGYVEPWRLDLLIAVLFLIEAELEVLLLTEGSPNAWVAALMQLGIAVALALRRTAPLASVLLTLASFVGFAPLG